jgi:hypothetical protein
MSILLGIDQSHDGRLARGRHSSPRERRKTARPETGLMVGERMGLAHVRESRVRASGVAPRRNGFLAADDVLGARSQHDLLTRDGAAALHAPPRVLLADDLRLKAA